LVNSIVEVTKEKNIDVSLALGPHDQHVRDSYTQPWRNDIQIINLDLEGIARYFLNFKCIIMPDTGPMHMVAALGISLVQLFVNSNLKQYGYIGRNRFIIDKIVDENLFKQFISNQLDSAP
jgi:ADP-heptose:LPS heptosyltransferase